MLFTFYIVFFLHVILYSQQQDNNRIYWKENYKLTWEYFQGKPDNSFKFFAGTSYNYYYKYTIKGDKLFFIVRCYFEKSSSWAKEGKKSEGLLSHEQLHFNIGELYARKLKKKLTEYSFYEDNVNDFKVLSSKNSKEVKKEQQKYDYETNFSNDSTKQEIWNKKILQELDELKSFSSDTVVVILK